MGSQYSDAQQASHKKNAERKKDRIRRLKKALSGYKIDPKAAAAIKDKTILKYLDDDEAEQVADPFDPASVEKAFTSATDVSDEDDDQNKQEKGSRVAPQKKQVPQKESRVQTPEQESKLYESRFTNRNTKLFEKLLKEWTK